VPVRPGTRACCNAGTAHGLVRALKGFRDGHTNSGSHGDAGSVTRPRVLFLCTHNSVRSQMVEGLLRAVAVDRFEVHRAGTVATCVNPVAIRVVRRSASNAGTPSPAPVGGSPSARMSPRG